MGTSKKYKSKSYSSGREASKLSRFFYLLPILLTVGLLPFMVRLYEYDPKLSQFPWYYANTDPTFADTFLTYRQWWFTGIAFYMLLILLFRLAFNRKKLQASVCCIPLAVFAFFSLLSAVFSKYPGFAFGGSFEQFENVFVLMGYAVLVYYSLIVLESEQDIKYILYTLTVSTLGLGLIGSFQAFGYNLFNTQFVKKLIVPAGTVADISVTTSDTTAFMTLYNPNYVGVYVAMLFPLFAILLVFAKKYWERILYALTLLSLLVSLYGSGSKAAFLVIACEALVFVVFLRRVILKWWYLFIPAATALVLAFLLINQWNDYSYTNRIKAALQISPTEYGLESIDTMETGVKINYKGNELNLEYFMTAGNEFLVILRDGEYNEVSYDYKEDLSGFVITDERFSGFELTPTLYDTYVCLAVKIEGHDWIFSNSVSQDGYYYLTEKGKFDKLVSAEQVVFQNYERLFSGRGYIWSVTLPLLKKYIFLGSGADTFAMAFPQQDYYRLWRNGFSPAIMSKPHSLYLQVGVQDGVLAMLGLLAFFVIYLCQSLYLYINTKFHSFYEQLGVAVMLSVLGFAVMGISNDSSVTVSPIFWAIAGVGVFTNAQVRKARKSASEAK